MSAKPPVILPRDCYSGWEVRRLFARRNRAGVLVLLTRATLWKRRCKGQLPFVKFGPRLVMYPRVLIDAMLVKACETLVQLEDTRLEDARCTT